MSKMSKLEDVHVVLKGTTCAIVRPGNSRSVFPKFIGTHAQYDRIDVENVNDY